MVRKGAIDASEFRTLLSQTGWGGTPEMCKERFDDLWRRYTEYKIQLEADLKDMQYGPRVGDAVLVHGGVSGVVSLRDEPGFRRVKFIDGSEARYPSDILTVLNNPAGSLLDLARRIKGEGFEFGDTVEVEGSIEDESGEVKEVLENNVYLVKLQSGNEEEISGSLLRLVKKGRSSATLQEAAYYDASTSDLSDDK